MNTELEALHKKQRNAALEVKDIKKEIRLKAGKVICDALAEIGIKSNPSDILFTINGIWIEATDTSLGDLTLYDLSEGKVIKEVTFKDAYGDSVTLCHKGYHYRFKSDYDYMNAENVIIVYENGKCYYLFPGQTMTFNGKLLKWTGPEEGFEPYEPAAECYW